MFEGCRRRGAFPFTRVWISVCSKHLAYDERCTQCRCGSWNYTAAIKFWSAVHSVSPRVWFFFMNWGHYRSVWELFRASLDFVPPR